VGRFRHSDNSDKYRAYIVVEVANSDKAASGIGKFKLTYFKLMLPETSDDREGRRNLAALRPGERIIR